MLNDKDRAGGIASGPSKDTSSSSPYNTGGRKRFVSKKAPNGKRPDASSKEAKPSTAPADINPGGFSRYLALIFLVLVLGLAVFLSVMIGNSARDVVLQKQQAFSSLLAENLNHQIFRRYTLPTLFSYGRIALRQPAQYERLDQLIEQLIHGMNVQELNIFDHNQYISYSTNRNKLGRNDLASAEVIAAMTGTDLTFNLDKKHSFWQTFFMPGLEEGSFTLRTTYPLRIENRLASTEEDGPIMGVMEFRQDITSDIASVVRFQWSIIGIALVSSLMIFFLMVFFLRRAEAALAARVEEKNRLQEQLHQHEKLAGMGRVIAGIAHEIRNPLGIICSSTELLLGRAKCLDDSSRGILQATYDESRRLSKTVTDFLDYARPRSPQQDTIDVASVLEQAAIFMKPELERCNVLLHWSPPEQSLLASGDKDLLYRAVYNILGNAVQALEDTPPEAGPGKIWMDAVRLEPFKPPLNNNGVLLSDPVSGTLVLSKEGAMEDAAAVYSASSEPEICISIRDNGPGFDLTDTRSYVDPFFTTKSGGSGLGLAIVDSIINSHGGRLELSSHPAGGAVVKIFLPLAK